MYLQVDQHSNDYMIDQLEDIEDSIERLDSEIDAMVMMKKLAQDILDLTDLENNVNEACIKVALEM